MSTAVLPARFGVALPDEAMPPDEFRRAIDRGIGSRRHRQPFQVPVDVLRERRHRGVPPRRLLLHRLEHDGVEVAAKVAIPDSCQLFTTYL